PGAARGPVRGGPDHRRLPRRGAHRREVGGNGGTGEDRDSHRSQEGGTGGRGGRRGAPARRQASQQRPPRLTRSSLRRPIASEGACASLPAKQKLMGASSYGGAPRSVQGQCPRSIPPPP